METKKLYRSKKDRVFAGVCGGIGEYLGVDPTVTSGSDFRIYGKRCAGLYCGSYPDTGKSGVLRKYRKTLICSLCIRAFCVKNFIKVLKLFAM